MKGIFFLPLLLLLPLVASAQLAQIQRLGASNRQFAGLGFGADQGVTTGIQYGRVIPIGGRPILLTAEWAAPVGKRVFDDSRVGLQLSGSLHPGRRWQIPVSLGAGAAFTQNKIARLNSLNLLVGIRPGFYARRWHLAGDIFYNKILAVHLRPSEYYREAYYAEAQDGWYRNAGGQLKLGLSGGLSLGRNDLTLRAGIAATEKGQPNVLPAYAVIGYGRWF